MLEGEIFLPSPVLPIGRSATRSRLLCSLLLSSLLAACGGGGGENPVVEEVPVSATTPPQDPAPPSLGRQIDRIGRAAVSTTLLEPFADDESRALTLDAYNETARSEGSAFSAKIRASLAIYDGLDAQCSNQLLASMEVANSERYAALAELLADDRLILDTTVGACEAYFNVELNQAGLTGLEDCGGRTPLHDVVDLSYTLLAGDSVTPISDGVAEDSVTASLDVFPFLRPNAPIPAPPAIGQQIDRMGRAAIATALISPVSDDLTRGADLDAYNAASPADWVTFQANIQRHLAVYDGLDGQCGNQLLIDDAVSSSARYGPLADLLTDDRLYIDSVQGSCGLYLGLELNEAGHVANAFCGGRTPLVDTIDVSYTALVGDLSVPIGDGVGVDETDHPAEEFPFMAAP